jgi:hypothetical protein
MAITKELLSESTNGKPIQISATTGAGADTIHTASSTAKDEIWLWVTNTHTADVALTLSMGDAETEGEIILDTVVISPNASPTPVMAGFILTGSVVLEAFADTTNKLNVYGYVNRIS